MTDILTRKTREAISHDPARMMDDQLAGVPEAWRHLMQLERPLEGVNICCMNGRPGSRWDFAVAGGPALSVSILLEGHMEAAIVNGEEFRIDSGQTVLSVVRQEVSGWNLFDTERDFRMVNIHLSQQALRGLTGLQMDDLLGGLHSHKRRMAHVDVSMEALPVFSSLQRVANEICHCRYPQSPARKVYLCAKVAEALASVLDPAVRESGPGATSGVVPADRSRLARAHTLIERQYGEPWSVKTLATAVGLNEKRLQAGFRALYGCTVHERLTRVRLDVAQSMLASGCSVTHTAQDIGFSSLSHFSKVFRKSIGVSPKQWLQGQRSACA